MSRLRPKKIISSPTPSPSRQTTLMWAGVVSCLLIIIIFSGWAIKMQFSSLNWQTTQEKMLLDKTRYSWNKAEQATVHESDLQKELDKAKVKDAINNMFNTTTTSTPF